MKLSYEQERRLTDELIRACEGQWDIILPRVIPDIAEAIAAGPRRHVRCILPGHGGANDFRITSNFAESGSVICTCTSKNKVKGGLDLVMRARQCDFMTAKRLLMDAIGNSRFHIDDDFVPPPVRRVDPEDERKKAEALKRQSDATKAAISRIWSETLSLTHPDAEPARLWFQNRGVMPIGLPITDVRFHPSMRYKHGDRYIGDYPCIISMMRDINGKTRTLHRTFISTDGHKPPELVAIEADTRRLYEVPKELTVNGSAIQLDTPSACLMLAEGLETALAVRLVTGLPTWACTTEGLLRRVELPESVKLVTVWADRDRSDTGQAAASELVERLRKEGRRAVALLPPRPIPDGKKGIDWNDMLLDLGVKQVRNEFQVKQWMGIMQPALAELGDSHRIGAPIGSDILAVA